MGDALGLGVHLDALRQGRTVSSPAPGACPETNSCAPITTFLRGRRRYQLYVRMNLYTLGHPCPVRGPMIHWMHQNIKSSRVSLSLLPHAHRSDGPAWVRWRHVLSFAIPVLGGINNMMLLVGQRVQMGVGCVSLGSGVPVPVECFQLPHLVRGCRRCPPGRRASARKVVDHLPGSWAWRVTVGWVVS